ncbi:MAG: hypothetical protein ACRESQ_02555 [Gammaproteobacteria bacterium]
MKTHRPIKALILFLLTTILLLPLAAIAAYGPPQESNAAQAAQNNNIVLHLGKIKVKGQKQIIKTLQAIKVALNQPESSDPKLQNVVVCRLTNDIGSHANQILTCATNRTLATRRRVTQLGFITPIPAGGGESARITVLNEYLQGVPSNIMHVPVNGSALRALLEKILLPATQATAPPAASSHP